MLTVQSEPSNLCPNTKDRPIQWLITTDEHIISGGSFASFQVQIDVTGGPNDEDLILAGVTFSTDNSTPYTFNTFDPTGTSQQVAQNLADAIQANSVFQEYQVFLTSIGGGIWVVNAVNFNFEVQPNWTFDDTGLTVLQVTLSDTNGTALQVKNMRLWYRLYSDTAPITNERYSAIPIDQTFTLYSEIPLVLNGAIRPGLTSTMPQFSDDVPVSDLEFHEKVHLRFGLVELDEDCVEIRSLAGSSQSIIAVNTIHQIPDFRLFADHCPNFINRVKWLTDRPLEDNVCQDSYEWAHIWVDNNGVYIGNFRVQYTLRDINGGTLGDVVRSISDAERAWVVPIGPNADALTAATHSWDVVIQGQVEVPGPSIEWQNYSEVITRTKKDCNCKAAELYFQEDRGSFRTITFDKVLNRSVESDEIVYELPIDWENSIKGTQYFFDGERYNMAHNSDQVFTLRSERIINDDIREKYEQLLRSPKVYIRTQNQASTDIMRRIIFPRSAYQTFKGDAGGALKIDIPFRFNNRLRTH